MQPLEAHIHVYTYFVYGEKWPLGGGLYLYAEQLITLHVMLFLYSSLIIVITLISSSYVNNTMSPNIEVEYSKPEKR